jgi:histidine triad (HIT) family protein
MKNPDCLFCKIIEGKIPSTKIFENEKVLAFKDLHPSAAKHYLFVHKNHTRDVNDLIQTEPAQLIDLYSAIQKVTVQEELDHGGFRVVTNMGSNAGQTVFHTHFHLLAGETLRGFGR